MEHHCDFHYAPESSLLHCALVSIAKELDQETLVVRENIALLPSHIKHRLLLYIGQHRANGLTIHELRKLLQEEEKSETAEGYPSVITTSIRCLDLSRSIGATLTLEDLSNSPANRSQISFPFLTHLCLARPGPSVSWSALIAFAIQVPSLSCLSLAYWTLPEDRCLEGRPDPASVAIYLAQLSNILCCLQHLDVEGCNTWVSALRTPNAVDWNGGWKNVQTLNLSQGPMPVGVQLEGGDETDAWIEGEVETLRIQAWINHCRTSDNMNTKQVQIQHGWNPQNSMLKFVIDRAWEEDQDSGPLCWIWQRYGRHPRKD